MTNYVVEATGLSIVRGSAQVLRGLDLTVSEGVITGLLGPSGSGKTTLMRAIVGLQAVRDGRILVLGRNAGTASLRSDVAYAPQGTSVYPDLSVVENVGYFARCVHAKEEDVDRVLSQVELTPYADRLAGSLSGGQRSRVSLAIALLGSPRLLVLDEPTVGLDPVLREQLWRLFAELAEDGVTLLVSSHVMDEAERCDDLLLLRDGKLLTQESPTSLKERTSTVSLDAAFLSLVSTGSESS
jgi:ABC-2 type transport system ATP-binding protein